MHDLCHAFDCCAPPDPADQPASARPVLALRKWFDMQGCYEFRCFVAEGNLVGVSQRDCANFYSFLLEQQQQVCVCVCARARVCVCVCARVCVCVRARVRVRVSANFLLIISAAAGPRPSWALRDSPPVGAWSEHRHQGPVGGAGRW